MEGMAIGEVARLAGVPASTLRYYERVGLLSAPPRVNGRRRYHADVLQTLAVIQMFRRAGFTIAEMQLLLHGFQPETLPAVRWRSLAQEKLVELHAHMAETQQMIQLLQNGLQCGCLRLEDCALVHEAERKRDHAA